MADWKLRAYHLMPPALRNVAASTRGLQLRHWRYGPRTEQLVAEALEREYWSAEEWLIWQQERLSYLLHRAATQVPYYREQWQRRRREGDSASWEYLENWPILTKEEVRSNPQNFVVETANLKRLFCDKTSGTTGTPLPIWFSRDTSQRWYALVEARTRRWYGVTYQEPWAMIGGQLIVPPRTNRPPYWVRNVGLNQLYMSAFYINAETCQSYLNALKEHKITHIIGYSSAIYSLAQLAQELRLTAPHLRYVYTNAEALWPEWKALIKKVFQCTVQSTYSMTEMVLGAAECQHELMHIWPETGVLEIFHPTKIKPLNPDKLGRFVQTGLFNPDMLFIRYEVGDWGGQVSNNGCQCGRTLPILSQIDGRSGDILRTRDGRSIFWANNVFYGVNIRELQVVQESIDHLRVRIVPTQHYSKEDRRIIVEKLKQRVGEVTIELEIVEAIPRSKNGKFQAVISRL